MVWNPEEERLRRLWAEAVNTGRASPAMISQSALPPGLMAQAAATPQVMERRLNQQQQYANQLRGTSMPQGRQAGDIYAAANPLEFLGSALNQGVGAVMARRIREQEPALDKAYQDQATAQLQIQDIYNQQKRADEEASRAIQQQQVDITGRKADEDIRSNRAMEAYRQQQLAQSWAGTTPLEAVDTTDQGRPPLFAMMRPDGTVIDTQTGKPVPEGYQLRQKLTGGGMGGATPKNPRRWSDVDGNERYTIDVGTDIIDQFTGQPVNQELASGGFFEEAPMSQSGRTGAAQKLAKDSAGIRSLASDFSAMVGVMDKYGIDYFSGDDPLGRFEKDDGAVGRLTRMLEDAVQPGAETGEIYSSMAAVLGAVIKNQAGMSQTKAEIQRVVDIYGQNWMSDPAVMGKAFRRLAPKIKEDIAAQIAGVDQTTLDQYRKRLGEFGVPDWTQWGQTEEGRAAPVSTSGGALPKSRGGSNGGGGRSAAVNRRPKSLDTMSDAEIEALSDEEIKRLLR